MLHRLGVVPAFRLAALASRDASLELIVNNRLIEIGLPQEQVACDHADLRAVQIQANTAHQILHHRLAQTGIRTALARFGALIASGNTGSNLLGNGSPSRMNPLPVVGYWLGPLAWRCR